MFKVPFEGLLDTQAILQATWGGLNNLYAFLFVNNHVPTDGDSLATYVQPTFVGYSTVGTGGWSVPQIIGSRSVIVATPVNFLVTAASPPDSCYGWGLYNNNTGKLIAVELFPGGVINMQNPGDTIIRIPTLTLRSEV